MIKVLQVTPRMDYGGVASVVRNFYSVLNHEEIRFDFVDHGQVENYHQELIDGGSIFYYFETIGKLDDLDSEISTANDVKSFKRHQAAEKEKKVKDE